MRKFLKIQFSGLFEIGHSFLQGVALAYRAHLGAFGNEKVLFFVNNRCKSSLGHGIITPWRIIYASAGGFNPKPAVHELRRCWFTNAVQSRGPGSIDDAILGHGAEKKSLQSLYLTLSDEDLIKTIDMMELDIGETEIRVRRSRSA